LTLSPNTIVEQQFEDKACTINHMEQLYIYAHFRIELSQNPSVRPTYLVTKYNRAEVGRCRSLQNSNAKGFKNSR